MPKKGDKFTSHSYQRWGEPEPVGKRSSESRNTVLKESYLHIPQSAAKKYGIFNSNKAGAQTNYDAYDKDGNKIATLKAQGDTKSGEVYAKQFSGSGNLKAMFPWLSKNKITDDDELEIEFLSEHSIKVEKKEK